MVPVPHDGSWNGKRVVSSDWIRASVAPQIAVGTQSNGPKYGYKWWLYPLALPEPDLMAVFNAWNILPGHLPPPTSHLPLIHIPGPAESFRTSRYMNSSPS